MNDKTSYPSPLPGFVLIKLPKKKEKIEGFVVVKDAEDKRTWAREGKILAIGVNENGFVRLHDPEIDTKPFFKVGATVYFSSFADHPISSKLTFIKYSDVLGVKHE